MSWLHLTKKWDRFIIATGLLPLQSDPTRELDFVKAFLARIRFFRVFKSSSISLDWHYCTYICDPSHFLFEVFSYDSKASGQIDMGGSYIGKRKSHFSQTTTRSDLQYNKFGRSALSIHSIILSHTHTHTHTHTQSLTLSLCRFLTKFFEKTKQSFRFTVLNVWISFCCL
jgi:hypothetical protein